MSYYYEMNAGQYVLHSPQGSPIGPVLDTVALALDKEQGILFKHGPVQSVQAWVAKTQAKLREQGPMGVEMANNLVVLEGQFELEELNRCLSTSGYVGVLYQKISRLLEQG